MKISTINEAVNRVNRGDNADDVLSDLRYAAKITFERVIEQFNNAAKSRPNWQDAARKIQAAYLSRNTTVPREKKAYKNRKKEPRSAAKPYVSTRQATTRRRKILIVLSHHSAGLTTRALMEHNKCDRYTLHTDMALLIDEGKVVHSVVASGKPTIWRLVK